MNRVESRTIQTVTKGRYKTPSKEKPKQVVISLLTDAEHEDLEFPVAATPKQVVISLLTDDEDEDLEFPVAATLSLRSHPPSQKYVPVDNSNFAAYAHTHRFLNNDKNRKRIAVR
jgi:hypothetical protein